MDTDDAVSRTLDLIDDLARDVVTVAGADAQTYLQSQIAQEIRDLPVDAARWTLVLDPTGKIDTLARIRRTGEDRFELDTDAGFGAGLLTRLNRFKIRVAADTSLVEAQQLVPSEEHERARIAAGWPRMGAEIMSGETIPATTGVVPFSVNFTKGCYPGQELVERMDSRGADAPRTLRIIDVEPGAVVGDPVVALDGSPVGVLTSVDAMTGFGLAMIKRGVEVGRLPTYAG